MPATGKVSIAIIGGGGIGSAVAYQLANAGHTVTIVARPGSARLAQLERDGAVVLASGEQAKVGTASSLTPRDNIDLVLVTVQAHQLGPVLPYLQTAAAQSILFLTNNWNPQAVRDTIGPRAEFGMPFIQASLDKDGQLTFNLGYQKSFLSSQQWVDVFSSAGIPALLEPDMPHWLRCHAPICVAFEGASAAAVRRNSGASWAEAMVYARGVHAAFALLEKQGVELYPWGKVWINRAAPHAFASVLWGMTKAKSVRDLLSLGVSECRAIVGEMLKSAAEAGLDEGKVKAIERMAPADT